MQDISAPVRKYRFWKCFNERTSIKSHGTNVSRRNPFIHLKIKTHAKTHAHVAAASAEPAGWFLEIWKCEKTEEHIISQTIVKHFKLNWHVSRLKNDEPIKILKFKIRHPPPLESHTAIAVSSGAIGWGKQSEREIGSEARVSMILWDSDARILKIETQKRNISMWYRNRIRRACEFIFFSNQTRAISKFITNTHLDATQERKRDVDWDWECGLLRAGCRCDLWLE